MSGTHRGSFDLQGPVFDQIWSIILETPESLVSVTWLIISASEKEVTRLDILITVLGRKYIFIVFPRSSGISRRLESLNWFQAGETEASI